jgi:hypothetical protein
VHFSAKYVTDAYQSLQFKIFDFSGLQRSHLFKLSANPLKRLRRGSLETSQRLYVHLRCSSCRIGNIKCVNSLIAIGWNDRLRL